VLSLGTDQELDSTSSKLGWRQFHEISRSLPWRSVTQSTYLLLTATHIEPHATLLQYLRFVDWSVYFLAAANGDPTTITDRVQGFRKLMLSLLQFFDLLCSPLPFNINLRAKNNICVSYEYSDHRSMIFHYFFCIIGNKLEKLNSAFGCICFLYKKKIYFKVSKNIAKKFYMDILIICMCLSSFVENQEFLWSR
jgi:hypothetical protein